jgi:hypothetical protein
VVLHIASPCFLPEGPGCVLLLFLFPCKPAL